MRWSLAMLLMLTGCFGSDSAQCTDGADGCACRVNVNRYGCDDGLTCRHEDLVCVPFDTACPPELIGTTCASGDGSAGVIDCINGLAVCRFAGIEGGDGDGDGDAVQDVAEPTGFNIELLEAFQLVDGDWVFRGAKCLYSPDEFERSCDVTYEFSELMPDPRGVPYNPIIIERLLARRVGLPGVLPGRAHRDCRLA